MCWSWTRTTQDSSSSYAYDELDDPNALWSAFVFFSSLSSLRACAPLTPSSAAVATTESRSDRQTDHQPMTPGFTMHMIVITYLHCLWDVQDYIVYLGHLPSPESDTSSEPDEGLSSLEAAHHDLLNQVLDDGRSDNIYSLFNWTRPIWYFRTDHARLSRRLWGVVCHGRARSRILSITK